MEIKAEKIDFKLCCRCCLKSDTEFYKLDTYMIDDLNDKKISLLECLTQCLRREDVSQLPKYICTGCSKTLHIAHKFMQTALEAHELLCRQLCIVAKEPDAPRKVQHAECYNGHRGGTEAAPGAAGIVRKKEYLIYDELEDTQKPLHFRCKVCGEKLQTKNALKEHVRIHLDLISYSCEMCTYDTRTLRKLKLHYRIFHHIEPNQQQLNPKTKKTDLLMSPTSNPLEKLPESRACTLEDIELLIPSAITRQELSQHLKKDPKSAVSHRRMPRRAKLNNKSEQPADEVNEVLQMATVISDPENLSALTTNELPQFNAVLGNELSVGTEFLLKSDGSVEQVINNNVVIEYINVPPAEQLVEDTPVLDDMAMDNTLLKQDPESLPMEVEDIIVEDVLTTGKTTVQPAPIRTTIAQGKHLERVCPTAKISRKKCIVCGKILATMARLRSHLMTHKNRPKYFCDQCNFYTLVNTDMARHYHSYHNDGDKSDKSESFSCDLCLFETRMRESLRFHYQSTHKMEPTDVQLRPNLLDEPDIHVAKNESNESNPKPMPDYPTGLTCAMCPSVFYFRWKYKEHLKDHVLAGQTPRGARHDIPSANKDDIDIINAAQAFVCTSSATTTTTTATCMAKTQYDVLTTTAMPSLRVMPTPNSADNAAKSMLDTVTAAPTSTATAEMASVGEMQDFIDGTDVAAVCTIPADAIQVVESDDIVIDNNINFNFNADQLFDDFGDEDDDADDDDDDDDENDNNESAIDQNLLLTSDDDDLDDFDDEQSKYLQKPFCMYCNKKFTSQYLFENHMFLHRGLAPYRCEMCTNLYNTKRALLRHYKAVHKRMPSRDMVQAKGDKVTVDRTPIETLNVDEHRPLTLMCGKCPFESLDRNEMRIHLGMHHHLDDDAFIISKLPFECPRCIRSYATKTSLVRHLQRSHLVATIIEQTSTTTTSAAETNTTDSMPATSRTFLHSNNNIATGAMATETTAAEAAVEGTMEAAVATSTAGLIATATTCGTVAQSTVNISSSCIVADSNHDVMAGTATTTANSTNYETIMTNGISTLGPLFNCADYDFIDPHDAAVMENPIAEKNEFSYTYTNHLKSKILAATEAAEILAQTARDSHSHQCSICQCTYPTMNLLKIHIKRHVAPNFDCSYCGNCFVRRSELDKHLRIHEEQKSYKCLEEGCEKAFNYKHHLKRHQDVAHLLKRYHCPLTNCGKRLTSQSQLKKHIIGHRGGLPPYKCTICERSYARRKLLRQHALKAHNVELTDNEIAEIYRANVGYTNPVDMKFYKYNDDAKLLSLLEAVKEAHDAKVETAATTIDEATTLAAQADCSNAEIAKAVVHIMGD